MHHDQLSNPKISSRQTQLKFATTHGEIDLSGQDQEIVVGQSSLSVPPGIHQLSQGETVPGFVLFEGGQGLIGREEGGGHVGGRTLQGGGGAGMKGGEFGYTFSEPEEERGGGTEDAQLDE